MYSLENAITAPASVVDTTPVLSFSGDLPDVAAGMICVAPARLDVGICFRVSSVAGIFSFTEKADLIIRSLCLTVNTAFQYCRRQIKRIRGFVSERVRNAAPRFVQRFLRL